MVGENLQRQKYVYFRRFLCTFAAGVNHFQAMDILRKELNSIYESQNLADEILDPGLAEICRTRIAICTEVDGNCRVITDASCNACQIFGGRFGAQLGLPAGMTTVNSSDEDEIYDRIHPEDLVDKRMLEYEFFRFVDALTPEEKLRYKATCRVRIRNKHNEYITASNSTQILRLSPTGKIWLIMCCYDLADNNKENRGISACIVNSSTGECLCPDFSEKRSHILTDREKEVLALIKSGKPSKIIADILGISVHTVNRHRQNILEKLSVGNSVEAIMAATAMRLM